MAHAQGEAVAGESQCETQSSRNPRRQARLKPRAEAQLRLLKACCEAASGEKRLPQPNFSLRARAFAARKAAFRCLSAGNPGHRQAF